MCGICGFIARKNISLNQLKDMNDTMYHRGPDDSGEEIFPWIDGYTVGMAQRRLSILDLSEMGHQPMHSANGRVTVVFNGEIYNFQELKKELSDYEFKSKCDTEVIIAGYIKWGIKFVEKLHGMFAIAIFDRATEELFLVRDRIGKKPLYYWLENEDLVYASEIKPIMTCPGFEKRVNNDVLMRYLYQQYINAPESIFENVYKLEPGRILCFKKGQVGITAYWDVTEVYHKQKAMGAPGYSEAKEELKMILQKAVKDRMITDVPLGTFLSGGYDSSLVTAMAQTISVEPIKTFSIGFREEKYNEAKYAKQIADYLGTKHTEYYIDEAEMLEMVESIPRYYDEPFADSSQIPSMLVSRLARQDVTVALSGDGGDEFFCGYNVYTQIKKAQNLDVVGGLIRGLCEFPIVRKTNILSKMPIRVRTIINNRDPQRKTQLSSDVYLQLIKCMLPEECISPYYLVEKKYNEKNWQMRRMLLDMETYLPGDILCKMDRASMKYSLECRCPILDTAVMEYSYRLPHEYKYQNGVKKRILKDIAYDYIPKELLDRPKVGFGVPLDKWLRGPLKEQLQEVSSKEFLIRQEIFDADKVQSIVSDYLVTGDGGPATGRNYSKVIWPYYVFQKWYAQYIK